MERTIKSTEAQQNFGAMLDMALEENEVIIERYGTPRAAIVSYRRYRDLVDAERELIRLRLQSAAAAAARAGDLSEEEIVRLLEEARTEVHEAAG